MCIFLDDETSKAHDGFAEHDSQHHGTLFSAHWEHFKTKHSKLYSNPEEEERRVDIFKENLDKINQHNDLFSKGKTDMGLTTGIILL